MADAPSTPGSYIGESRNGYFWNGTSWDQGGTVPSSAVPPSTMSLNSGAPTVPALPPYQGVPGVGMGNPSPPPATPTAPAPTTPTPTTPTPTPTPTPAPSTSPSGRPSILSTIMRVESGGRNVPQQIDDINMRKGDPAQGYYQITGGTWSEFGGDKTGHKSALAAPYTTQLQIAQNIPVERWGPATQQALRAAGYDFKPGETLGQMLTRYGEDPSATRPEDVGGSSASTAVAQAQPQGWVPPPSLLAAATPLADPAAAAAATTAAEAQKQQAKYADLTKQGQGLLGQGVTDAPRVQGPTATVHRPQAQAIGMPDFLQILAQQRLTQGT